MRNLNLTPLERHILHRSLDLRATRRRRATVVVMGITAAILLAGVAWLMQSWAFVLVVALVYIAVTIVEKVAYANAVLAYKSLIQKLKNRVEELEPTEESSQPVAPPDGE